MTYLNRVCMVSLIAQVVLFLDYLSYILDQFRWRLWLKGEIRQILKLLHPRFMTVSSNPAYRPAQRFTPLIHVGKGFFERGRCAWRVGQFVVNSHRAFSLAMKAVVCGRLQR